MISRRPNSRLSTENAPGPSTMMVSNIVTAKTIGSLESNRVDVQVGSSESSMPTPPNPTTAPTIGVRRPINRSVAAASAVKPTNHVAGVGFGSRK